MVDTGADRESATARIEGCYVYAISTPAAAAAATATAGIGGSPVGSVPAGSVAAVVSDLTPAETAWAVASSGPPTAPEDVGASQAGDAELLIVDAARAHEHVVERVLRAGPVVPLRFGALYSSRRDVEAMLLREHGALCAALEQVAGCAEWTVRVTWSDSATLGAVRARVEAEAASALDQSSGRAYLVARRAERDERRALGGLHEACAASLHEQLGARATAAVRHGRSTTLADPDRSTVLHASYLVRRPEEAAFAQELETLLTRGDQIGLRGEMTGPWPAYHFARLDSTEAGT